MYILCILYIILLFYQNISVNHVTTIHIRPCVPSGDVLYYVRTMYSRSVRVLINFTYFVSTQFIIINNSNNNNNRPERKITRR